MKVVLNKKYRNMKIGHTWRGQKNWQSNKRKRKQKIPAPTEGEIFF